MTWEDVCRLKKIQNLGFQSYVMQKDNRFTESMINDLLKEIMELETLMN